MGSRDNYGATDHGDLVFAKAGGEFGQAGDYLYSVFVPFQARQGAWGIFRVGPKQSAPTATAACKPPQPTGAPPAPQHYDDNLLRFNRQPPNVTPAPKY
jgi:hypothetical protein